MKSILLTFCLLLIGFHLNADEVIEDSIPVQLDIYKQKRKPLFFKTGSRIHLQLGGQLGGNINYFKYKNGLQRDVSVGYQGGLFLRVSRQLAFVQIEINMLRSLVFLENGVFNREIGSNIPFDKLKLKYYTVGMPLIFGVYAVKNPLYKLRIYSGLELDFLTKVKATIEQNDNEIYRLTKPEKRNIFRTTQFSFQLGTGMDIAMFIFDVKYRIGMSSYFRERYRTQTHLFQFTMGAIF